MKSLQRRVVFINEGLIVDKYTKALEDGEYCKSLIDKYINSNTKEKLFLIKEYGKLFAYIVERFSNFCTNADEVFLCIDEYYKYFIQQTIDVVTIPDLLKNKHIEFDYIRENIYKLSIPVENDYFDGIIESFSTGVINLDGVLKRMLGPYLDKECIDLSIKAIYKYLSNFGSLAIIDEFCVPTISECIMVYSGLEKSIKTQYNIGMLLYILLNSFSIEDSVKYLRDTYSLGELITEKESSSISSNDEVTRTREFDLLAEMANSLPK